MAAAVPRGRLYLLSVERGVRISGRHYELGPLAAEGYARQLSPPLFR